MSDNNTIYLRNKNTISVQSEALYAPARGTVP